MWQDRAGTVPAVKNRKIIQGIGQRDGDGVLLAGNEAEQLEFVGFAVLRFLIGEQLLL